MFFRDKWFYKAFYKVKADRRDNLSRGKKMSVSKGIK